MTDELKRLPLHDHHAEAGARFVPFAGFEMPIQYTKLTEEHAAVRTNVGFFDVSHMGEIRVAGPKAVEVVNTLVTHDLRNTAPGQARYTLLCHPDGGIVDDLLAYKISDEEIFLCVNGANRAKDWAHIQAHAPEGATLTHESEDWLQFAVQGPKAPAVLAPIADVDVAGMGYYHFEMGQIAGVRCMISRTGYTGEDGFEVYIPADGGESVYQAIIGSGEGFGMAMCGLGCRDTLRLEAKFPLYGQDLTDTTNPLEAGLSWAVKLDKPEPFVGRAAIEAVKAEGVKRRLRGFVLDGKGVPRAHYGVFDGDAQVGELTSGTWSPTLEKGIGMGYVDVAHAKKKTLDIAIRKRRVPASVTRKPFYKRD